MARVVPQADLPGAAAAAVLHAAVQRSVPELRIAAVRVDAVLLGRISTGQLIAQPDARGLLRFGIRRRHGAGRVRAAGLGLVPTAGLVRRPVLEPAARVALGQVVGLVGGVALGQPVVLVVDAMLGQAIGLVADVVLGRALARVARLVGPESRVRLVAITTVHGAAHPLVGEQKIPVVEAHPITEAQMLAQIAMDLLAETGLLHVTLRHPKVGAGIRRLKQR